MSPVDDELLSLYLDNALSTSERAALEQRLATDPVLQAALDDLRRAVAILKATPTLASPRNFTLDPARYGRRAARRPVGLLRLGAALAATIVVVLAILLANRNPLISGSAVVGSSGVAMLPTSTTAARSAVLATALPPPSAAPHIQQMTSTPQVSSMNAGLVPTTATLRKAALPAATLAATMQVGAAPTMTAMMTATAPGTLQQAQAATQSATQSAAQNAVATAAEFAAPSAADGSSNSPGASDQAVPSAPKDTDVITLILRWLLTLLKSLSR